MYIAFVVIISLIASIDARTVPQKCKININSDLGTPQPLYLYHNTTEFLELEGGSSQIHLDAKQQIDLYCTDGFRPPISEKVQVLTATCVSGKQFTIKNKTFNLKNATCNSILGHTTRLTKRKCVAGKTVEIGFVVKGAWIPLYEVCHDNETASTLWVHHQLTPKSQQFQRAVDRPSWIKGNFYRGINPKDLYSKTTQRKTIGEILGSQKIADDLISMDSDLYLARGHLAAKSDFIFGSHQLASFYFINAAPQWQTFNNGNWLQIEIGVKKFCEKRNIDTDVYTGTYGIFTYHDVHGTEQDIYLAWDKKTGAHRIPVPRFYYKVLIADEIQAGIVFIGVNHPYISMKQIKSDYILCPDVSDKVNYVNWDRSNITIGYSYACSVNDFVKIADTHLPTLPKVTKLLI